MPRLRTVVPTIAVLLTSATLIATTGAAARPSAKVIHGRDASSTEVGATSIVSIGDAGASSAWNSFFCGGTLIAPQLVVTARHCVDESPFITDARQLVVFRGSGPNVDLPKQGWSGVNTVQVVSIHRSPGANAKQFNTGGDLALLRLSAPLPDAVPMAYAHPADAAWFAPRSTGVKLLGWGATKDFDERTGAAAGNYPTKLQTTDIPIVSQATCLKSATQPKIAVHYLCAGAPGVPAIARASCYGDSGGPLLAADPAGDPNSDATPRRLVGIVSHGDSDRCAGAYTRYVRVADWASWIDGFMATSSNAPSGTLPPVIASAKRVGASSIKIVAAPVVSGPAPVHLLVTLKNHADTKDLLAAGTVGGAGGTIAIPPTRTGKLSLILRAIDAAGNESGASAPKTIATAVDKVKPRIRTLTVKAINRYTWRLNWSRPIENDRVAEIEVYSRRTGTSRWGFDDVLSCPGCWTSKSGAMPLTAMFSEPAGPRQFKLIPIDRAGNFGPAVASK